MLRRSKAPPAARYKVSSRSASGPAVVAAVDTEDDDDADGEEQDNDYRRRNNAEIWSRARDVADGDAWSPSRDEIKTEGNSRKRKLRSRMNKERFAKFALVSNRVLVVDGISGAALDHNAKAKCRWTRAVLVVDAEMGTFEAVVETKDDRDVLETLERYGLEHVHDLADKIVIPGILDVGFHYLPALRSQDLSTEEFNAAMATATREAASGGVTTIIDTPREALPMALALSLLSKRGALLKQCSQLYSNVGLVSRVDLRSNPDLTLIPLMRERGCFGMAVHLNVLGSDAVAGVSVSSSTGKPGSPNSSSITSAISSTAVSPTRGLGRVMRFSPGGAPATQNNFSGAINENNTTSSGSAGSLKNVLVRPSRAAGVLKALSQNNMALIVDMSNVGRSLGPSGHPGESTASSISSSSSSSSRETIATTTTTVTSKSSVNGKGNPAGSGTPKSRTSSLLETPSPPSSFGTLGSFSKADDDVSHALDKTHLDDRVEEDQKQTSPEHYYGQSCNGVATNRLGRFVMGGLSCGNDDCPEGDNENVKDSANKLTMNDKESLHGDLRDLRRRHMVQSLKACAIFQRASHETEPASVSATATSQEQLNASVSSSTSSNAIKSSQGSNISDRKDPLENDESSPDRPASIVSHISTPMSVQPVVRRVPRSARSCGTFTAGQRGNTSPGSVTSNSSLRSLRRQRRSSSFNLRSWRLDQDEFCSEAPEATNVQSSSTSPTSVHGTRSVQGTPSRRDAQSVNSIYMSTPRQTLWSRRQRHNSRSMLRGHSDSLDFDLEDEEDRDLPAGALELTDAPQVGPDLGEELTSTTQNNFGSGLAMVLDSDASSNSLQERTPSKPTASMGAPTAVPSRAYSSSSKSGLPPVGQPPAFSSARRQRFASNRSVPTRSPEMNEPTHQESDAEEDADNVLLDEEGHSDHAARAAQHKHLGARLTMNRFASSQRRHSVDSQGVATNESSSPSRAQPISASMPTNPPLIPTVGQQGPASRRSSAFSSPGSSSLSPTNRRLHGHGRSSSFSSAVSPTGPTSSDQHGSLGRSTAFQPRGRFASGDLTVLQTRLFSNTPNSKPISESLNREPSNISSRTLLHALSSPCQDEIEKSHVPRLVLGRFQSPSGPVRLWKQHHTSSNESESNVGSDMVTETEEVASGPLTSADIASTTLSSSLSSSSTAASMHNALQQQQQQQQQQKTRMGLLSTGGPKLAALLSFTKLLATAQQVRGVDAVSKVYLALGGSETNMLVQELETAQCILEDTGTDRRGVIVSPRVLSSVKNIVANSWMQTRPEKLEEAIDRLTRVTADSLGLGLSKGRLAAGFDADFVILDSRGDDDVTNLVVDTTYCRGLPVYTREMAPSEDKTVPLKTFASGQMLHSVIR